MNRGISKIFKGMMISSAIGVSLLMNQGIISAEEEKKEEAAFLQEYSVVWRDFHSAVGKCSMQFPDDPDHVTEQMSMPEDGYSLRYDAYISPLGKESVVMLLIAQYPDFVDESYAQMSLEGFLNGILTYNPSNQLIFADLLLVQGHEALEFFIRTGNVYFRGRAVMVKNSLYLMAMECDMQSYEESNYHQFVNSFKLAN